MTQSGVSMSRSTSSTLRVGGSLQLWGGAPSLSKVYVVIRVIFFLINVCNKKIVASCNFFLR